MKSHKKLPFIKKSHKAIWIALSVFVGLIVIVGVAGSLYLRSLTSLVQEPEFTGNPTIEESDMTEQGETTVNMPDSTEQIKEAEKEIEQVKQAIPIPQVKDVYNILLIGTDNRGNEVNGRSDAMIILSVNKRTKKIHLASLMRGLYVNIPGRGYGMLNASFSYGGSKLLLQTIEENLRVKIDDYVMINFAGFTKAIDAVGGVDIKLSEGEANLLGGELKTGVNHLNGDTALAYSRIRYLDSDYARTGRQRTVIESLIKQMVTRNPVKIDSLARTILPLVKTNLSGSQLISRAVNGLGYRSYPISQLMLPIAGTHETIIVRGAQMVRFDVTKNVEALHKFMYQD